MGERVIPHVDDGRGVDVRETIEAAREIRRVVVCTEDAAELRVENVLRDDSEKKRKIRR